MIKLDIKYVNSINNAKSLADLFPLVQNAIELEHATVPPYLTAMFSFKPKTEREIWEIIHSVVIEEMLHMSIACNIMNALGGRPSVNKASFIPEYPTKLPMGIGGHDDDDDKKPLIVGLAKYSKEQVKEVFMEIEQPEEPLDLSKRKKARGIQLPTYSTIGEFYEALKSKILEYGPPILPGNPKKQVTSHFFSRQLLFPITTPQNAADAIDIIIEQGEGSPKSPATNFDFEKEIAHYYRFEELVKGKRLMKDEGAKYGYSYSGPEIPYNPINVWNIYPNTKTAMLPEHSAERRRMDEFNACYHNLLDGLHQTFNGKPRQLDDTIGLMYDLKLYAEKLCGTPFPGKEGYTIGPSFEFVKPTPPAV